MATLELAPSLADIKTGESKLRQNEYPGRVLILGRVAHYAVVAYALTGRSEPSRNRVFAQEADGYRTLPVTAQTEADGSTRKVRDMTTPFDPIRHYKATKHKKGLFVATNGAQTDYILEDMLKAATLEDAMRAAPEVDGIKLSEFEPAETDFTPRIASYVDLTAYAHRPTTGLGRVRRDDDSGLPIYDTWTAPSIDALPSEVGYVMQTYRGDGKPLPAFIEDPYMVPLHEDIEVATAQIWDMLPEANRAALLVTAIDLGNLAMTELRVDIHNMAA